MPGSRIDRNTSNRDPHPLEHSSDRVGPAAAPPIPRRAPAIVGPSRPMPGNGRGPYHSDGDTPSTRDHPMIDPKATTKRNYCRDHDKRPPAGNSTARDRKSVV